ncbi:MAG TPA: protein-glutamate O-methyltransferase CheR [Usitatibacter sp.]
MSEAADAIWERLAERVGERLGLAVPAQRLPDLRRAVERAAGELGFGDAAQCAMRLVAEPWDPERLNVLAAHLTVGETYFFRDPALFEALAESVLPTLMRRGERGSRCVRIWSAGCCTGEEAYSLAIVASQVLARFPGWSAQIRATDVNPRFLEKAAEGRYGPWSFRGMPPGYLARYFLPIGDARYVVRPDVRRLVEFRRDNLVDPGAEPFDDVDLLVCRNVLMYFTPAQMRRAIARLHAALAPDGWLVVSPSEAAAQRFPQFVPVMRGGAFMYRRKGVAQAGRARGEPAMRPPIPLPPEPPVPAPVPAAPAEGRQPPAQEPAAGRHPDFAACARDCADRGALDEALRWCDRWLAASRLDPAAHYLHAMVLLERGDRDAALAALTRALYVDPAHLLSHVACGNLARAAGREDEAQRHFRNALRLAAEMDSTDTVADSDGLSAGALRETLAALLEAAHPA